MRDTQSTSLSNFSTIAIVSLCSPQEFEVADWEEAAELAHGDTAQWQENWDDDAVDDFCLQLRAELQKTSVKIGDGQ